MSANDNGVPPVEVLNVETLDRKLASLKEQRKQVELNAVAALNQIDGAMGLAEQLKRELLGTDVEDAMAQDEEDNELMDAVDAVLEEGEVADAKA